jgi:hypothetical protein
MTRPTPAENLQSINNQRPIPAFRKDEPVYIPFKIERKPTKSETSGIDKKESNIFLFNYPPASTRGFAEWLSETTIASHICRQGKKRLHPTQKFSKRN